MLEYLMTETGLVPNLIMIMVAIVIGLMIAE